MIRATLSRLQTWTLATGLAASGANVSAADSELMRRVAAVDQCVVAYVAERQSFDSRLHRISRADVQIFLSEQLSSDIVFDPSLKAWKGPAIGDDLLTYCRDVGQKFLTAAVLAIETSQKTAQGSLGNMGTRSIASENALVQTFQNLIGRHSRGHSDISELAGKHAGLGADSIAHFAAASQAPDLYRWRDDRYHSQTADVSGASSEKRRASTVQSQAAVRDLLVDLLKRMRSAAKAADTELAITYLGIAAHVVQDLVFHRGLTLAQHSGLSYLKGHNPDNAEGEVGDARFKQAVSKTSWLLIAGRSLLATGEWDRIVDWKPGGTFDAKRELKRAFGTGGASDVEDISTMELLSYWALAHDYRTGVRPLGELETSPCGSDWGLVCWEVEPLLKSVEEKLR
jgi:hypothetical protein